VRRRIGEAWQVSVVGEDLSAAFAQNTSLLFGKIDGNDSEIVRHATVLRERFEAAHSLLKHRGIERHDDQPPA
jgi:hypothetical protein